MHTVRIVTLLSTLTLAALATEVAAKNGVRASRSCRNAIGYANRRLARVALAQVDRCHRKAGKGTGGRDCNTLTDQKAVTGGSAPTAYGSWGTRGTSLIGQRCPPGEPVRDAYPAQDPGGTLDATSGLVAASATALEGALPPGIAATAPAIAICRDGIGTARSRVALGFVRDATRCQRRLDAGSTTFGPLAAECEPAPRQREAKASAIIADACGPLDGAIVGSCDPLPGCVVDSARTTGLLIARSAYGGQCGNGALDEGEECDDGNRIEDDMCTNACRRPVCGNLVVEGAEECDDGNDVDFDGCTDCRLAVCGDGIAEPPTEECDDGNDVDLDGCTGCRVDSTACADGHIFVAVRFIYDADAFTPIAGMRLQLRYTPDRVSIPGSGGTAEVRGSLVRRPPGFFGATDLASVAGGPEDTLESVVALGSGAIVPGEFEVVRFDCPTGTAIQPGDFACRAVEVVDPFLNAVPQDAVDAQTRCGFVVTAVQP